MRLFLVRHGETESNRAGLALGRADAPLNERGLWQAQRLAVALAAEPFAAVYSSPLQRTMQTAEAIATLHRLPVVQAPELIEMDIGDLEGLTFPEIRERHPGLLEKWAAPEGPSTPVFGRESLADVQERAWRFLTSLPNRDSEEAVCAVTHNFVILSVLTRALGMNLSEFRRLRHEVAAISVLEFQGQRVRLLRVNDCCHLSDPDNH